ncbi:MAG: trehalose-phosphatase [Pseudomonadota bacterium]
MTVPATSWPDLLASDALFLDFDGTLAELQDDPGAVHLAAGLDEILRQCAAKLDGALAIISGRDIDDLTQRVPNDLWRFGNHGLRAAAPGALPTPSPQAAPADLVTRLASAITPFHGVRIEDKGAVIAIHYRAAPDSAEALSPQLEDIVSDFKDYKLQHGKMVFEAKPLAANKGRCIAGALAQVPFTGRRPIMIGDDTTDEDAFAAVQTAGGLGIKVGAGATIADYRMANVADTHQFLRGFIKS